MSKLLELAGVWLLGALAFAVFVIAAALLADGIRLLRTGSHYWDPSEIDGPSGSSYTDAASPAPVSVKTDGAAPQRLSAPTRSDARTGGRELKERDS